MTVREGKPGPPPRVQHTHKPTCARAHFRSRARRICCSCRGHGKDAIAGNATKSFGNKTLTQPLTLAAHVLLKSALHDVTIKKQTSERVVTRRWKTTGRVWQRLLPVNCRCETLMGITVIRGCFVLHIISQFA